jgi:hypothetical protein
MKSPSFNGLNDTPFRYLHMYLDRKGPEKRKVQKPKHFSVESMHPPKIGVDHFTNK